MDKPRPYHEWHEDLGDVLWWLWPIQSAPYCGSPIDLGYTVNVDFGVTSSQVNFEPIEAERSFQIGGWPFPEKDEDGLDLSHRLYWTPLPDADAIDRAIRNDIRGYCDRCDDSGYVETHSGGIWTGENVTTSRTFCDCACGDDAKRQEGAA